MAIVINEFEVMVEPPPPPQPKAPVQESGTQQTAPLRPEEIATIMQVREERMQRVRAD